ncbi:MAG: hypothetical protein H7Y04_12675 [Verrucomicrobia bacterium]|nr:hypothetical protein [Cytophagales bacterium]
MRKFLPLILIVLIACSSGKKSLQKGNYEEAMMKAISRLRSNPNNKKARETLREGFPLTVKYHLSLVNDLKNSNQVFKYEQMMNSYQQLNVIYEEIQRCPACREEIRNNQSYYVEVDGLREPAASDRYQAGNAAMNRDNSRQSAKEAYFHFLKASQIMPGYSDVNQKVGESKFAATLKVLFEQVPVHSRAYSLSNEFFQNQINQFVGSERMNEFVRFYTPDEAKATNLNQPDQIVRMQFDDFVVGQVFLKESTETFQRDSVVVGTVKEGNLTKNVYGTVKARLTVFQKQITSGGLMDLQVYDPYLRRVVHQEKLPGEFIWRSQWGNFQGDERALTKEQLNICGLREVPPPPPQQLFIEFCRPIYTQTTNSLRRFYRNY